MSWGARRVFRLCGERQEAFVTCRVATSAVACSPSPAAQCRSELNSEIVSVAESSALGFTGRPSAQPACGGRGCRRHADGLGTEFIGTQMGPE